MSRFVLKKLRDLVTTLFGISIISFTLIRLIPGDPVLLQLGERGISKEVYEETKRNMGLHLPAHTQYINYIKGALKGDLGKSFITKREITEEFLSRFPATVELGTAAMIFAVLLGIPLGILAAIKRNSLFDQITMGGSLVGYSMPIFWWGLILILVFSVILRWTPVSGRISVLYDIDSVTGFYLLDTLRPAVISEEGFAPFISAIRHIILPSIALGTIPLAITARMTRSSMLEVLGEDYIRTAKAKGLPYWRIISVHALRNAMIPIITVVGLTFGSIITGAILTETIFSWPGIGKWIVSSVIGLDYKAVQGGILMIGTLVIIVNTCVDLLYALINPKMRS